MNSAAAAQAAAAQGFLQLEKDKPIVWASIFGKEAPVEVEIGCGKGLFLFSRAVENPVTHFLGLDRVVKWMKRRQKNAENQELKNLKFSKADARETVANIPDASVRIFHIYFPDPWPKRRHRKRRLVDTGFLLMLYQKLEAGGSIYLATDFRDYFEQMETCARALEVPCAVRTAGERMIGPVKTNYEMKFAAAGRPLYYLEIKK